MITYYVIYKMKNEEKIPVKAFEDKKSAQKYLWLNRLPGAKREIVSTKLEKTEKIYIRQYREIVFGKPILVNEYSSREIDGYQYLIRAEPKEPLYVKMYHPLISIIILLLFASILARMTNQILLVHVFFSIILCFLVGILLLEMVFLFREVR